MKTDNYTPYGEEWKKEMMKLPKKILIDMIVKSNQEQQSREARVYAELFPGAQWNETEHQKPMKGFEVIGYNPNWVDADTNPKGTRICMFEDDGYWVSAMWSNTLDEYRTRYSNDFDESEMYEYGKEYQVPTLWTEIPKLISNPCHMYQCPICGQEKELVNDLYCQDCNNGIIDVLGLKN